MSDATLNTLRSALGWIEHWQADVECGLKPTPESLQRAADELRAAIAIAKRQTVSPPSIMDAHFSRVLAPYASEK
jgi:hypothetical protein